MEQRHRAVEDVVARERTGARMGGARRPALAHLHGLGGAGGARGEDQQVERGGIGCGVWERSSGVRLHADRPSRAVDAVHRHVEVETLEQGRVLGIGEHGRAVTVADVAGQLLAPAGGVDADDDPLAQRRRAEEEHVLGNVVEQHADVPARQREAVEPGGTRARLPHHLAPRPPPVVGDQARVVVAGPLAEQGRDRLSASSGLRPGPIGAGRAGARAVALLLRISVSSGLRPGPIGAGRAGARAVALLLRISAPSGLRPGRVSHEEGRARARR